MHLQFRLAEQINSANVTLVNADVNYYTQYLHLSALGFDAKAHGDIFHNER